MERLLSALRSHGVVDTDSKTVDWADLTWLLLDGISALAHGTSSTVVETLVLLPAAVAELVDSSDAEAQAAVQAWVACACAAYASAVLPKQLLTAVTDATHDRLVQVLCQPLMGLPTRLVERVAFHFQNNWDLTPPKADAGAEPNVTSPKADNSTKASSDPRPQAASPEHFLDFVAEVHTTLVATVAALLSDVEPATLRSAILQEVVRDAATAITALYGQRYVQPALARAAVDTAPLLHLATVTSAFAETLLNDDAATAVGTPIPAASIFTQSPAITAAWLLAERQFILVQVLGGRDDLVARLLDAETGAATADWRRAQLAVALSSGDVVSRGSAKIGLPYSSFLPSQLRITPHAMRAQVQRARFLFDTRATGSAGATQAGWEAFVDRVLVCVLQWWLDVFDDVTRETQGMLAIVRGLVGPADHLLSQMHDCVLPSIRAALDDDAAAAVVASPANQRADAAPAQRLREGLVGTLEDETDKLMLLRDEGLRRLAYIATQAPDHSGDDADDGFGAVSHGPYEQSEAAVRALAQYCAPDTYQRIAATRGLVGASGRADEDVR
jgi:hypothetical protein